MDSLATLGMPSAGYGIRYEYGIFFQSIRDGYQVELSVTGCGLETSGNSPRPEFLYNVKFYGRVEQFHDNEGKHETTWLDAEEIMAMAYDTLYPG
jgi:starch phosphorylase